MASPKTSRGLRDNCGSRWLTTIWRCHIAVSASHCQSRSQREARDRCDVGNRSLQPWRLDLRIMSGRRLNCCPIGFRLTSWMPYPIWSVFIHHLRKFITAVEGHYPGVSLGDEYGVFWELRVPDENGGGTGRGYAMAVCVRGASMMRCCRRSSGHVILACPSTRSFDTTMRCSTPHHYQRRQPCQSLARQWSPCSSWSPWS